jgi:hypothetical protein
VGVRQDLTDYRVAIKRRYEITDAIKQKMVDAVEKIFDDPLSNKREIVAAAKVVIAAEQQNQTDERLLSDNARILEFAERIGIRAEVEEAAKAQPGGVAGFIDAAKPANELQDAP